VTLPLQQLGTLDLRDKSTPSQSTIGVVAVINGTTVLDYDATGAYTATPPSLSCAAAGHAADGTRRLDLDLTQRLAQATGVGLDYQLRVPRAGVEIGVVASGTEELLGTVTLTVTADQHRLQIEANGTATTVTGRVRFDDATVATISGTPTQPVFTGSGGTTLSPADVAGLRQLFDFVDALFDGIDDLIAPAYFVFGINLGQ